MNEYERLIQEIKDYDSNTFFAKGCDLTDEEAEELAEKCVRWFVVNRLDGELLDRFLYDIRNDE